MAKKAYFFINIINFKILKMQRVFIHQNFIFLQPVPLIGYSTGRNKVHVSSSWIHSTHKVQYLQQIMPNNSSYITTVFQRIHDRPLPRIFFFSQQMQNDSCVTMSFGLVCKNKSLVFSQFDFKYCILKAWTQILIPSKEGSISQAAEDSKTC